MFNYKDEQISLASHLDLETSRCLRQEWEEFLRDLPKKERIWNLMVKLDHALAAPPSYLSWLESLGQDIDGRRDYAQDVATIVDQVMEDLEKRKPL
jgi:hypothetical protein